MLIPCAWSTYDGCKVLGQLEQAECPSEESESKIPDSALETPAQPKKYYDQSLTVVQLRLLYQGQCFQSGVFRKRQKFRENAKLTKFFTFSVKFW